ncbi:MAG TPA: hypothetical protein VFD82_06510 [Planctomycetota bacterium]|nr:hypothetical protein [Planctomycetota bacterium]
MSRNDASLLVLGLQVLRGATLVATALTLPGQEVHHDRGPGELLPPQVQVRPPAAPPMEDLTDSAFWWAFQADSLLPPRVAQPLPPSTTTMVADALLAATRATEPELAWQSLWALARVARHEPALAALLHARVNEGGLLARDGVIGEVAAVAVGLAARGDDKVLAALAARAGDAKAPRRQRAFAFYGLGLAAQDTTAPKAQFCVLSAVERALLPESDADPELRCAALHALALVRIDVAPNLAAPALVMLERAWAAESRAAPVEVRAHVPPAVAALLRPADAGAEPWRERFAAALGDKASTRAVARSAVLALGALCRPWDAGDSPDARYGERLREIAGAHLDQQTRYYALVAMGQAGGAQHRAFLLERLQGKGAKVIERPWVAFGLAAGSVRTGAAADEVVAAIGAAVSGTRPPNQRAAIACADRAVRAQPWPDHDSEFKERYRHQMPGNPSDDVRTGELVRILGDASVPLQQRCLAATALGQLGDASPRHWSAVLARAVDYRSGTAVLLGVPNGVLRLP